VYSITGLPPGVYYARTFASTNNYQDEAYNDIPCIPSCNVFSGTPIFVGAGTTTSGINFGLAAGGIISGTITDAVTSAALASVTVNVYNTSGLFVGSGFTNTSGVYSVAGLPSGSYFARTFISSVTPGYIDELYNNIPCPCTITAGNPIVVTAGAITANVNFGLSTTPPVGTGGITGTVTDATNGALLPSVTVQVYNSSGVFVANTGTNASGVYVVTGLAPGTYYAAAFPSGVLNYIQEAYNDVPCVPCFTTTITTSTPITVVSGANTPNINFPLSPGAILTGTVSDLSTGFLRSSLTVTAYTNTGTTARSASSDAAGIHYVKGLPTGQYFARTGLNGAASVELYNNIPCPYSACSVTTGTALNLTAGAAQSGVNFSFLPIGSPDLAIDFGGAGIYLLSSGNKWTQLHTFNPVSMAKGDLDGNGRDDLIVNFGPGIGLYAWMNHTTWTFLHPFSPSQMVTGDLNNDGRDDLVVVFPGYGLFRYNNGSWSALHNLEPTKLAIGQLDGSAGKELIVNFTGFGVYVFANNAAWTQLHTLNVSVLLTADIDGNGRDDVILVFPGAGLWAYKNNATWQNLHPSTPIAVVGGHLDTSSQADLVVDFGPGVGLFSYRNNSTWTFLHGLSSQGILLADRDATATDEVLVNFGGAGLYQLGSNGVWAQVHPLSPEGLVAGQIH
jgi:hypothetical protein